MLIRAIRGWNPPGIFLPTHRSPPRIDGVLDENIRNASEACRTCQFCLPSMINFLQGISHVIGRNLKKNSSDVQTSETQAPNPCKMTAFSIAKIISCAACAVTAS